MPSENGYGGRGPLGVGHCPHCFWQVTLPGPAAAVRRKAQALRLTELWEVHTQCREVSPALDTWVQSALSLEPRDLKSLVLPLRRVDVDLSCLVSPPLRRVDVDLSCLVSPLHGFRKMRRWRSKSIWLLSSF